MASRLQDVLLRGVAASRPAAASVAVGTLYYSTDTFVIEQSDGAAWNSYSSTSAGVTQLTGDVTAGPGSGSIAATIANDAVTYAKMQNISAASRILGRGSAGGSGDTQELTVGSGLTITGTVLDTAASGGITQLTGDVTAGPGSGSQAATIPNDTVTYAKIQNVSATDRLLGLDSAGPANIEEIPVSSGLEFTGGPGIRVTAAVRTRQIGITVDGGGVLITTGSKGFKSFPVAGTITGVRLLANAAGNIQFDILKSTYAAFPTTATIVSAAPPTLSGVQKNEDTTLTGWTTAVAAGDVFEFQITGTPLTITRVTLELTIVVTG